MPSLGSRGDTTSTLAQRRRRGALADFFEGQRVGARFTPLDFLPGRDDTAGGGQISSSQFNQAISDVFFGAISSDERRRGGRGGVVGPSGIAGFGSERIVGRANLSVGGQIQRDIDIFEELQRQGLLPQQVLDRSIRSRPSDAREQSLLLIRHTAPPPLNRGGQHQFGRSPREAEFIQGLRGLPQTFARGGESLSLVQREGIPSGSSTALARRTREATPRIGVAQLTSQQVAAFFQPPDFLARSSEERAQLTQDFGEFQRIRAILPFFPQATTVDEAIQIQERRSNQLRAEGPSTGPVFVRGTTPGGARGLPSGSPAFARPGGSPLPTSTARFGEAKLGGPSEEEDRRIANFLARSLNLKDEDLAVALQLGVRGDATTREAVRRATAAVRQPTAPAFQGAPRNFIGLFRRGRLVLDDEGRLVNVPA
jgi:hypothetical protein